MDSPIVLQLESDNILYKVLTEGGQPNAYRYATRPCYGRSENVLP